VNVTCLAPGAVKTELYDRGSKAVQVAARLGLLADPRTVARAGVRGMLRRKALVLPGAGAMLMAYGMALIPRWLIGLVRRHTHYLPKPNA
jgi:short-subunit dehydrogenase